MSGVEKLKPREDLVLPSRLAASAQRTAGVQMHMDEFDAWLAERASAHDFTVDRIPFSGLRGWKFENDIGNLVHESGRFFSVEGLCLRAPGSAERFQPIINQPEVGILGILVKEFDGVLHFLMQAKMEPGNPVPLMLSPTVQATRSNYTQVHRGAKVKYLEYFTGRRPARVIADVLQSEHGDWFYRKRNRNMLVEAAADEAVPLEDDFCWLTLGQINALLARDNVINMDSRTVLACLPPVGPEAGAADRFSRSLAASRDPGAGAVSTTAELLSWFTGLRADCPLEAGRLPLGALPGWHRDDKEISRDDGRHFRVVAADVRAGSREVASWSQPLVEPVGRGLSAFLVREFDGVLHVLVRAAAEGGFGDGVELAPTVQCMSAGELEEETSPFLAHVPVQGSPRIHYDALHAEEGGRFLNAVSRYVVAEADAAATEALPPAHAWATVSQLTALLRHSQYVNVQARTLVACLNSLG
ncbi:NDP-hexose 2,3-dehydratase family protein [Streptomyces sp. NPDC002491]